MLPSVSVTVSFTEIGTVVSATLSLDAETGKEIIGYTWEENLRLSTEQLLTILK